MMEYAELARKLMDCITGYRQTQAIYTATKLNIPDILSQHPMTTDALATQCGCDEKALYRLLIALETIPIVKQNNQENFTLTPLGELLTTHHPYSLRAPALLFGEVIYHTWETLLTSIQQGTTGFEYEHGGSFYDYLHCHPDYHKLFNTFMVQSFTRGVNTVLDYLDFSNSKCVVDVGGGYGHELKPILSAYPHLKGIVFDTKQTIEQAKTVMQKNNESRCEYVGGNFFQSIPRADTYLLKYILHNWDDTNAQKILRTCHESIEPGGRLIIIEMLKPSGPDPHPAKWFDLEMMILCNGQIRSKAQFVKLLETTGFQCQSVKNTEAPLSIIEGQAV